MSDRDHPPVPIATYRLQLTPTFGFAAAIGVFDHLVRLGVSHVYLSPIAQAVPDSSHGYDVVDHRVVRHEFGGEAGLGELLDRAADHRLGVLVDHVPNHMSAARAELNEWWWSMLRDGPGCEAARWFDVDWERGGGKVLIPKLGEPLTEAIAAGRIEIRVDDRGPELRYGPLRFPMRPGTELLSVGDAVRDQWYELMCWRDERRNVRRFFTIDDLVAVRVDDPDVAAAVDTIPAALADHEAFAGVRVDHVDGLADPGGYLRSLRQRIGEDRLLLVEKILAPGEELPPGWPVDGTTGYEHIRITEHTFLDPAAERPLTDQWVELTGDDRPFAAWEDDARREVLDTGLAPDLDRFVDLARRRLGSRTHDGPLREAAVELTIGLHRYRTYLGDDPDAPARVAEAAEAARRTRPDLADEVDALADLVVGDIEVATRWQQLSSPTMAKGAEDRAFYRYLRWASLCEVGGAPGQFASGTEAFHDHQRSVARRAPRTLNAGTTHDTKRSEGVRARSLALAEIADDWVSTVRSWIDTHADLAADVDPATLLLALQTVVTAWPIDAERLTEYLHKAAREADLHTSWTDPRPEYDAALAQLAATLVDEVAAQLDDPDATALTPAACIQRTLRAGWSNSLAALAIRLTAPGVPDLYQGTAAFTYSLVDPDNRVEPDWDARRALVAGAADSDLPGAWEHHDEEITKAVVITRTLALRRRCADAFGPGAGYLPLAVDGPESSRLLAFGRRAPGVDAGADVVTLVVRRSIGAGDWSGTTLTLPAGTWRDVLTDDAPTRVGGAAVPVEWWLDHAPVAVLERVGA